jgi:subtilisin family serine protease
LSAHLNRLIAHGKGNFAGRFARTFDKKVNGKTVTFAHLFIKADKAALPALKALGVTINTVTKSGIMTAVAPVAKIQAIMAVSGVKGIAAGERVKKYMNVAAGASGVNLPDTSFPRAANAGDGVIVGVIDTGIDVEHPDFIDAAGNTRVLAIWDHTLDPADVGYLASNPSGFTYGTEWAKSKIQGGYSTCLHRDKDGHGTHVAGTAAGNGSASSYEGPYTGLAPKAELVIVKFDFDNEKDRNSDTAILDGINWIFQKAAAEGKPAVINMSLGSDYGPHDGTSAEEEGIDDLVGSDRIVVVAAGNAGSAYSGPAFDTWGAPIHGSGNSNTTDDIVIETSPSYVASGADDYIFFDIWYPGTDTCRIQITTPSGVKYPPNFTGRNRNLWKTNGTAGGYDTSEGLVYVSNGTGSKSWDTSNSDNNIYIEISDYYAKGPAPGKWTVEIIPLSGTGDYHSWHGYSSSMRQSYFWYDSGTTSHTWGTAGSYASDSVMTIGKPATAKGVISVGAYQTKNTWPAREYADWTDPYSSYSLIQQSYGVSPIDYYNPFYLGDLAFFSSRGPSRDGRYQPFISAPGVGIVASLSQTVLNDPQESYFRKLNRVEYGGYHATLQGTSMACPDATGSVALLLEEAKKQGLSPTPDDIKGYLKDGARTDTITGAVPNNDWGHGKADVVGALAKIAAPPPPPPPALDITTTSLADGTEGVSYSETVSATGGTAPYTWAVVSGSLPAGMSLNAGTGEISGTPTGPAGTSSFTMQVTDAASATDTRALSITINPASSGNPAPTVTGVNPSSGTPGTSYTVSVTGTGFASGATVDFGNRIMVQGVTFVSSTEISCAIKVHPRASAGPRDVTVTNPDGQSATLTGGFTVN